jgi:branched-chain amino acid transport system substrate-binding protein
MKTKRHFILFAVVMMIAVSLLSACTTAAPTPDTAAIEAAESAAAAAEARLAEAEAALEAAQADAAASEEEIAAAEAAAEAAMQEAEEAMAAADAAAEAAAPTEAPPPTDLPPKDTIVFGQVTSLSGPNAVGVDSTTGPVHEMWIADVNAAGGIYVEEYGKQMPIELIQYDDQSDIGTMTQLLERLILEDQVDFLLPPWSTAFMFAAAPIANQHEYILIGGAGGAVQLKEMIHDLPYYFQVISFADTQMPALADILEELGVESVAIIFIGDLHGIEYSGVLVPELGLRGIDVKMVKEYPPNPTDLSPMLKEAEALEVDAFIGFTYPPATFLATGQAIELGIDFDVFYLNVVTFSPDYRDAFGPLSEGMMGGGAWNGKTSDLAQEFLDHYIDFHGKEPDYWGSIFYYSSLQHLQQAIEDAGTLDQRVIRDYLATETYDTYLGPYHYENQFFRDHPGQIGQWQNGVFEVVNPGDTRTAPPIIKPAWALPPDEG